MSFEAKYGGTCGACTERIHVGDLATYDEDEIVHVDCEGSGRQVRKADACATCWLTKPCDCEGPA
jgi:Zn ribbon nucleic-acid-binding protein